MNNLTVIRYTFKPYFNGSFENGVWFDYNGKPLIVKVYNGRQCVNAKNKRYGLVTLRKFAQKEEVELIEMPF